MGAGGRRAEGMRRAKLNTILLQGNKFHALTGRYAHARIQGTLRMKIGSYAAVIVEGVVKGSYHVAVVGIGAVGSEMIRVLKQRNFPCSFVASVRAQCA